MPQFAASLLPGRAAVARCFCSKSWIQRNSRKRFEQMQPYIAGASLLDVGAAEGWIGHFAKQRLGINVQLLDVIDLNQTELPHRLYDGYTFPYADKQYDTVTLLLTLHHCSEPERVLVEAVRVAQRRVIVTESVYRTGWGKRLLTVLDGGFNGLRSKRNMAPALHFRTVPQWRETFRRRHLYIEDEKWLSRGLHEQRLFVLLREPVSSGGIS